MKLDVELLAHAKGNSEVVPGNIYPAMGGRRSPGTAFWLVVACSETSAHCIGFNNEGEPVSTTSYLKGAMRERPIVGKANISAVYLKKAST